MWYVVYIEIIAVLIIIIIIVTILFRSKFSFQVHQTRSGKIFCLQKLLFTIQNLFGMKHADLQPGTILHSLKSPAWCTMSSSYSQ